MDKYYESQGLISQGFQIVTQEVFHSPLGVVLLGDFRIVGLDSSDEVVFEKSVQPGWTTEASTIDVGTSTRSVSQVGVTSTINLSFTPKSQVASGE